MDFIVTTPSNELYLDVWMGNPQNVDTLLCDISTLTNAEVDAYGSIKPGTPLQADGTLISGAGQTVYTVVPSPVQLRGRTDNANLAGDARDIHVPAPTDGSVQRKAIEKNLGRVLNANEIAAFGIAGCKIKLVG